MSVRYTMHQNRHSLLTCGTHHCRLDFEIWNHCQQLKSGKCKQKGNEAQSAETKKEPALLVREDS